MYKPKPINTDDVVLDDELLALTERIAKNVMGVWTHFRRLELWRGQGL